MTLLPFMASARALCLAPPLLLGAVEPATLEPACVFNNEYSIF